MRYLAVEPCGPLRDDLRAALVAYAGVAPHSREASIDSFLRVLGHGKTRPDMETAEIKNVMEGFACG